MTTVLTAGQTLSCRAGRYTIQYVPQERVHRVETRTGSVVGQPVEDLTASFRTEGTARLVARAVAESLRSGASIPQARAAVVAACRFVLATAHSGPSVDAALTADLQRAISVFQSDADRLAAEHTAAKLAADFETRQRDLRALSRSDELAQVLSGDRYGFARMRRAHFEAARAELTEPVHLRKPHARSIACGTTGRVRVTERLSETTCPRCRHDGDPVRRTRAIRVEAAHAEALERDREAVA